MKAIAFYLPQFHEIPENSDAWGKGFTEWVNVRKAVKFYEWQEQPRIPQGKNYYNLLNVDVLKWQARLAKEAGIYGFCMYHYWFNGRLVLEKPLELFLQNKDITTKLCLAWANEPWTKTWHGAGGNKEVLIPQTYGGRKEWEAHYQYFLPFFRDTRYMKENGAPIVVIYRLKNIPEFNQMIKYWNKRAVEDGFSGIFVISMNTMQEHVYESHWVNACVDFEPNRTKYEVLKGIDICNTELPAVIDYKEICQKMLDTPHKKNQFRGVFVDYDDTPRRQHRGICIKDKSPEVFEETLKKSIELSLLEDNEYIFLNAWNEWGESNYLEPDELYGMKYLQTVKKCLEDSGNVREKSIG